MSASPTVEQPLRINLWSGPRNLSTALMYSFAQRSDTRVVDEPLYGHYLRVSGAEHPGRELVLASVESDGARAVRQTILGPADRPVMFFKQMAHHLVKVDRAFLTKTANVLLVRDPLEMLPSLAQNIAEPRLKETSLPQQVELYEYLKKHDQEPPVLDAKQLLLDPRGVLSQLCDRLDIEFEPAMLRWKPGPRPEDGVWAPHWYANVHRSTGFQRYAPKETPFPEHLELVLTQCRPYYERLSALAIQAHVHA
jgi:hypothetical protein